MVDPESSFLRSAKRYSEFQKKQCPFLNLYLYLKDMEKVTPDGILIFIQDKFESKVWKERKEICFEVES